jgi:molybdenum cofactor cytidylyltransferase
MNNTNKQVALAILAAGKSGRYGSPKQITLIKNQTMLQRTIDFCIPLGIPIFLILGANIKKIESKIDSTAITIIENKNWEEGVASSIRTAVEKIPSNFSRILFLASDQVNVNSHSLIKLLEKSKEFPTKIICASYKDTVGIPAIFPKELYNDLLALKGDKGGKSILIREDKESIKVSMEEANVDIDTVNDLESFLDS